MICSTKTENLTAVEGYIMADRRNLFFFMVMTKQRSLKNETNLSYFRREWIYHIRSSKNANAIVSVGDDATFLQAVRKTGFREDCLYAGISTKDEISFYCDFHIDHVDTALQEITKMKLKCENIQQFR